MWKERKEGGMRGREEKEECVGGVRGKHQNRVGEGEEGCWCERENEEKLKKERGKAEERYKGE